MNIWDSWAWNYRKARSLAAAVVFLLAILAMLSLRCNPMVQREEVLGLILEVEAQDLKMPDTGESAARVLVATPHETEVRLLLPPPVPRPGDFIPMKAEHYKKGNIEYSLDLEKWRTEGPS